MTKFTKAFLAMLTNDEAAVLAEYALCLALFSATTFLQCVTVAQLMAHSYLTSATNMQQMSVGVFEQIAGGA
jgi:hypothetical protein